MSKTLFPMPIWTQIIELSIKLTNVSQLQFGAGENAGLEENLAAAQQQMQVMQQLHKTTEMCWDLCVGTPSSSLSSREETCLTNCVGRFIDTTLLITNRFSQLAQKMQR